LQPQITQHFFFLEKRKPVLKEKLFILTFALGIFH